MLLPPPSSSGQAIGGNLFVAIMISNKTRRPVAGATYSRGMCSRAGVAHFGNVARRLPDQKANI